MSTPIMHFGTTAICGSSDKLSTKFKISFGSYINKCVVCECLLLANGDLTHNAKILNDLAINGSRWYEQALKRHIKNK